MVGEGVRKNVGEVGSAITSGLFHQYHKLWKPAVWIHHLGLFSPHKILSSDSPTDINMTKGTLLTYTRIQLWPMCSPDW